MTIDGKETEEICVRMGSMRTVKFLLKEHGKMLDAGFELRP